MAEPSLTGPDVAVVVMASGDGRLLADALEGVQAQSVPHRLVVTAAPGTAPGPGAQLPEGALVVTGASAAARRNAALAAVPGARTAVFLDDDVLLRHDHLEQLLAFLRAHPGVVALTGRVLLDGPATGREVGLDEARAALSAERTDALQPPWRPAREVYPSAFAVRLVSPEGAPLPERFDEALAAGSWLEGVDFARRASRHGSVVHAAGPALVVRGAHVHEPARQEPLGYAQVAHPVHLRRTGVVPAGEALTGVVRALVANAAGLRGAERPWRLQRLRGNARAVSDALRGGLDPARGPRAEPGRAQPSAAR
ncbi:glycosyltransferase family A protein [Quadrisphaera sp. KR29]|uniref:glycosyltransferase family A protein n=1 Tax=Quadrisphaera sp. KR29 TaxID=3461391 RepID=UPI004044984D